MCLNSWAHTSRVCALQQEKPQQRDVWAPQPMSSPYSPQLEKAPTAMKTQRSQKVTNFKKYLKKCATHYEPC